MRDPILYLLALALYGAVSGLFWRGLLKGSPAPEHTRNTGILALGFGAVVLHAAILYGSLNPPGEINLALTNAVSLFAWVIAVLFLIACLTKPIDNLGVIIMPFAGLTVLVEWLWPGSHLLPEPTTPLQSLHIVISILAFGLLSLGAMQSVLLLVQERQLRHKQPGGFMRALPPLETMESLMLQLVGIGFVLLTVTAVSGIFFSDEVFDEPRKFAHHIVLSTLAWMVFGVFLIGHWRFGWRGRTAIRWVLGGITLLALAYFGTKFVLEIILKR